MTYPIFFRIRSLYTLFKQVGTMERDRKIHTQGTGKDENKVENIRPNDGSAKGLDDLDYIGLAAQVQGEDMNEGNEVTADIPVGAADQKTGNTDALHNNNTTNDYANEVDVNAGGVALDKSPGATNQGNNPSNPDLATTPNNRADNDLSDDREAVARSVDEDAEKQTGRPTGAIYGSGGEVIAAKGFDQDNTTTSGSDPANQ